MKLSDIVRKDKKRIKRELAHERKKGNPPEEKEHKKMTDGEGDSYTGTKY